MSTDKKKTARRSAWSYVAAIIVFCVMAGAIFGDPLSPMVLLLLWKVGLPDSIAIPSILGGLLVGTALTWLIRRRAAAIGPPTLAFWRNVEPAVFVGVALIAWLIIAATVAWLWREREIVRFEPDKIETNTFLSSLRAPWQSPMFFWHAAALKDCRGYAWSYGEMAFFPLPPNVAVNVLPRAWLEECGIRRSY